MARLNQFAFAGQLINGPNIRVGKIVGQFGLPPLRGANWIAQNATGEQFVPKLHGGRDIILPLIVRDTPNGISQGIFDMIARWAATRTQSTLANILDTGTRTGMAECTGWTQTDMTSAGLTFAGLLTFHLADPWLYGPTVSGSVTPVNVLTFGLPVVNPTGALARASMTLVVPAIISGQPIVVAYWGGSAVSTVADNFATPYAWTRIEQKQIDASVYYIELWIGSSGVGTTGTITVTPVAATAIAGVAYPLAGASTAAGLAAVDVHLNANTNNTQTQTLSMGPAAIGEGAIYLGAQFGGGIMTAHPGSPWSSIPLYAPTGAHQADVDTYLSPAYGVSLSATWQSSQVASAISAVGALIKGSGNVAATLSIPNPGTTRCESMTLTFTGPIINPLVVNQNGVSVGIFGTVAAGTTLVIDTGAFTAQNAGVNAIGSVTHSGATTFMVLEPGANTLTVYGAGCTGSTLLTVSFAPPNL